jgi:galactokinase
MTGAQLADRLVGHGLDSADAAGKSGLFDTALTAFNAMTDSPLQEAWWVPGRLEVFGKHTDYAGGRTLVAAIPRGFAFVAAPRADAEIHVLDGTLGERVVIGHPRSGLAGWPRYVQTTVNRLDRNFRGGRRGVNVAFASDLPRAAGLSSSSALMVGIAAVLTAEWNLAGREEWKRSIRGDTGTAMYYSCIENGQDFHALAGDAGVGTRGGSEDHAAILLGSPACLSAFAFCPMRRLDEVPVAGAWRFVIATSGVTAEKTGGAQHPYNRLSDGVRLLLALWNTHNEPALSLGAALAPGPPAISRLHGLITRSGFPDWTCDTLRRRLDHFVAENDIVLAALGGFRSADAEELGALATASQRGAEDLLGNQIPQTAALVEAARLAGAFAACSFGAGFGGSVWALVDRDLAAFASEWLARYRTRYPGLEALVFGAQPGPPLTRLV